MSKSQQRPQPKRSGAADRRRAGARLPASKRRSPEPPELEWHLESVIQYATD